MEQRSSKTTPLQRLLQGMKPEDSRICEIKQKTGRHRTTIWRWKTGGSYPSRSDAEMLCSIFHGLSINDCYSGENNMEPYYINTGIPESVFYYPGVISVSVDRHEGYKKWLLCQYQKTIDTPDGVIGVAQHVTSMIYRQNEHAIRIISIGPDACAAAEVIKSIGGPSLKIDLPQE